MNYDIPRLWSDLINDGDVEGVLALYAENAPLFATFDPQPLDRPEQRRKYFEGFLGRPGAGVENLGDKTLARLAALVSEETLERAVAVVRRGDRETAPSLAVSALPSRLYALKLRASYVGTGEGTGEEKAEAFGDFGDRDPPGPKTKTIRLSRCVSCARVFPTNAVPFLSCARAERARAGRRRTRASRPSAARTLQR